MLKVWMVGASPPSPLITEVALSWLGAAMVLLYIAVHKDGAQSVM